MHEHFIRAKLAVALIVAVTVGFPAGASSQQKTTSASDFSMTIQTVSRTIKAGAPVWVDVTESNNSDKIQLFPRPNATDRGGNVFITDVWDSKSLRCAESTFYRKFQGHLTPEEMHEEMTSTDLGMYGGNVPLVKPGGAVEYQMDIGRLYDLSKPGTYTIQVQRPVQSNKITVTVTP
jgi:hypothetical protein